MPPLIKIKALSSRSSKVKSINDLSLSKQISNLKNKINELFPETPKSLEASEQLKIRQRSSRPSIGSKTPKVTTIREIIQRKYYSPNSKSLNGTKSKKYFPYKKGQHIVYELPLVQIRQNKSQSSRNSVSSLISLNINRKIINHSRNSSIGREQAGKKLRMSQSKRRIKSQQKVSERKADTSLLNHKRSLKGLKNSTEIGANTENICIGNKKSLKLISVQQLFSQLDIKSELMRLNNLKICQHKNSAEIVSVKPIKFCEKESLLKKKQPEQLLNSNLIKLKKVKAKKSNLFPFRVQTERQHNNNNKIKLLADPRQSLRIGQTLRKLGFADRSNFEIKGWSSSNIQNQDFKKQQETDELNEKIETERSLRNSSSPEKVKQVNEESGQQKEKSSESSEEPILTIQQLEQAILS